MESKEVKADRFQRLAPKRTTEILKKLDILGHCANHQSYYYTDEQAKEIFLAIEKKVNEVKMRFKSPANDEFRLSA